MRWDDERYVRLYTRDTADWMGLSFLAQGLFCLILRKVDRAGLLALGKQGRKAVAVTIGHPGDWPRLEGALEELVADGCVRIEGDHLVVPNFIEAQEASQSDVARKRAQRERARARVTRDTQEVTSCDIGSRNVTKCHDVTDAVTRRRDMSLQPSQPNQPSQPSQTEPAVKEAAAVAAAAPWESFRDALADRMAVPRDWLRVAQADRAVEVREQVSREVERLGMHRAVEVAFEASLKAKRKPQYLAYFVGSLQDASVQKHSAIIPAAPHSAFIPEEDNGRFDMVLPQSPHIPEDDNGRF